MDTPTAVLIGAALVGVALVVVLRRPAAPEPTAGNALPASQFMPQPPTRPSVGQQAGSLLSAGATLISQGRDLFNDLKGLF